MRYSPSEKLRIVLSVRQPRLPVAQAAAERGGADALKDRSSAPHRVWNRIVPVVEKAMLDCAQEFPEPSPRELAVRFSDACGGGTDSEYLLLPAAQGERPGQEPRLHRPCSREAVPRQSPTSCGRPT